MNREEQIEEMAKIIDELYNVYDTTAGDIAEGLYNTGYRKADVAEIERLKAENEELTKVVSSKVYDLIDNTKEIADAREAWEKQAKIGVLNELKDKMFEREYMGVKYKERIFYESEIDEMIAEVQNAEDKS